MTIACPDCGTLQHLPVLRRGDVAVCPRCGARLERVNARSIAAALGCALTTLLLLLPANLLPLLSLNLAGMTHRTLLGSGVIALAAQGWLLLALVVGLCAVVLPFVRFGLLVAALGSVHLRLGWRWQGAAFRWAILLDRWAMPDVFLIACVVGYARVRSQAAIIHVDAGGYCFIGAALMAMLARALLDRRSVWRAIAAEQEVPEGAAVLSCAVCNLVQPLDEEGRPCPRCGLTLRARWPGSWERTVALVVAALLLYVPANLYPMDLTRYLGHTQSYRIVDGVMALFGAGLWPLGVLVSCTSIGIPVAKLLGLGWCVLAVRTRSRRFLLLRTRIYRMIDEAGRWSSVDPFIIAVLVPLMHLRSLVTTQAGGAATAFVAVVMLTMIASRGFDPRLMWDAALEGAPHAHG